MKCLANISSQLGRYEESPGIPHHRQTIWYFEMVSCELSEAKQKLLKAKWKAKSRTVTKRRYKYSSIDTRRQYEQLRPKSNWKIDFAAPDQHYISLGNIVLILRGAAWIDISRSNGNSDLIRVHERGSFNGSERLNCRWKGKVYLDAVRVISSAASKDEGRGPGWRDWRSDGNPGKTIFRLGPDLWVQPGRNPTERWSEHDVMIRIPISILRLNCFENWSDIAGVDTWPWHWWDCIQHSPSCSDCNWSTDVQIYHQEPSQINA